jgi:hypothetical protein
LLRSLETVSLTAKEYCQRAVSWLRSVQNADGSFGESLLSYDKPETKGRETHGVADRLGLDRIAGRGGSERSCDSQGGVLFDGPAKCRWLLERE